MLCDNFISVKVTLHSQRSRSGPLFLSVCLKGDKEPSLLAYAPDSSEWLTWKPPFACCEGSLSLIPSQLPPLFCMSVAWKGRKTVGGDEGLWMVLQSSAGSVWLVNFFRIWGSCSHCESLLHFWDNVKSPPAHPITQSSCSLHLWWTQ